MLNQKTPLFSRKNTCVVLIDLWGLSASQIDQLGPVYQAWLETRQKIAELVSAANAFHIPIYMDNHGLPISTCPSSLRQELLKSNVVFSEKAFVEEGDPSFQFLWHSRWRRSFIGNATAFMAFVAAKGLRYLYSWWKNSEKEPWIKNTVNFEDYEHLIYAGYAMDGCVAWSSREGQKVRCNGKACGYREVSGYHKKYLIKDAGLVQHVLYHGKDGKLWPEFSKVMKACGADEPLPWKTAHELMDETIYFCDSFASQFCTPLFIHEFKEHLGYDEPLLRKVEHECS